MANFPRVWERSLADCGRMKGWKSADKPFPSVLSFISARGVGIVTTEAVLGMTGGI